MAVLGFPTMKRQMRVRQENVMAILLFATVLFVLAPFAAAQPTFSTTTFLEAVRTKFGKPASCKHPTCICSIADESIAWRLLSEYGSIFVAADAVRVPSHCIFENEKQVTEFQSSSRSSSEIMSGVTIELQDEAMTALLNAQAEARRIGLRITPLDGSIAGKRSYSDTIRIWNSRYLRALDHWVRRGKISPEEAQTARNDAVLVQIRKVMDWESTGLNFGTNIKGSIFSSTAPPGTSQHLSMLAFDVVQYANRNIRAIMNKHGWYQTVANDPPHFTFLGLTEKELPSRGLKNIVKGNYKFWVPDLK